MTHSTVVSLHPYFRAHHGRLADIRALLPTFVEKTKSEPKNLYYGFTLNGDEIFCREAYADAEGVLTHLENVGAEIGEMLKMADLTRIELHGPASELDKLREPLAHLNPVWFACDCGVERASESIRMA